MWTDETVVCYNWKPLCHASTVNKYELRLPTDRQRLKPHRMKSVVKPYITRLLSADPPEITDSFQLSGSLKYSSRRQFSLFSSHSFLLSVFCSALVSFSVLDVRDRRPSSLRLGDERISLPWKLSHHKKPLWAECVHISLVSVRHVCLLKARKHREFIKKLLKKINTVSNVRIKERKRIIVLSIPQWQKLTMKSWISKKGLSETVFVIIVMWKAPCWKMLLLIEDEATYDW